MKKFISAAILYLVISSGISAQSCLPDGITFSMQGQVDSFAINYTGCSLIGGNVVISGSGIQNLNGLSPLTAINGSLTIENNPALTGLSGLDNLVTVGGDIDLKLNPVLTDLAGLENLAVIDGSLMIRFTNLTNVDALSHLVAVRNILIENNNNLIHINGLKGISNIPGDVNIENNTVLANLNGFSNLSAINGVFAVASCSALINLSGLNNLIAAGGLSLENNDALVSLSGLEHLETIDGEFWIEGNDVLPDLAGLEQLHAVNEFFYISANNSLQDISELNHITSVNHLFIYHNPSLTACAISFICNQIAIAPHLLHFLENGPQCNTLEEVEANCAGTPVEVQVLTDKDGDCIPDTAGSEVPGILVNLKGSVYSFTRPTDADGKMYKKYFETGVFSLTLPQFPTANWAVCQDTLRINPDTIADTAKAVFLLRPLNSCPQLQTELNLPSFFRGCFFTTRIDVINRNTGTETAENTMVGVVMPAGLNVVSTIPSVSNTIGDTLYFDTGDLAPLASDTVSIWVMTACSAAIQGNTFCIEALGLFDNPCSSLQEISDVRVYSECLNDTIVRFTLKNILPGATQNPHDYIIIEDEIVLMSNPFNLGPFGSMTVDVPASGATYRMEATRLEDGTRIAKAHAGCGGFTPGLVTAFWLNNHLSDYDYDCREVILAFDPNQKSAVPKGIGDQHLLAANSPLTYTIDFQNTGTDTAFQVLLRDVMSPYLDMTTFRPGASSHAFTWEVRGADTLEVLFQPVMLPDSNANEAASHGWFSFTINQKPDLANGTIIENTASIIFDYNPPVITNTTFHTIGEMVVSVDEAPRQQNAGQWQVLGNPTVTSATFTAIKSVSGDKQFELMDITGKVLRSEYFNGQRFDFERNDLASGIYYFTITDRQGSAFNGKIVIR